MRRPLSFFGPFSALFSCCSPQTEHGIVLPLDLRQENVSVPGVKKQKEEKMFEKRKMSAAQEHPRPRVPLSDFSAVIILETAPFSSFNIFLLNSKHILFFNAKWILCAWLLSAVIKHKFVKAAVKRGRQARAEQSRAEERNREGEPQNLSSVKVHDTNPQLV